MRGIDFLMIIDRWGLSYHYIYNIEPNEIAELLLYLNDNAISPFLQQLSCRLSIFERPIVTACKDGKSYIYDCMRN